MRRSGPRPILPELVEVGDTIRVTYRVEDGVTRTSSGKVAEKIDLGPAYQMVTLEGGLLFTWNAHRDSRFKVELIDREPASQATLPGLEDIRERIKP